MRQLPLSPRAPRPGWIRFGLLALGVVLLGLAGYVGYVMYPRFHLPSVTGIPLLALAAGAGVAAFFSPCSFPLLLTLLVRNAGSGPGRTRRVLAFAVAFSVGIVAFLGALGSLIALGGRALASAVTFVSPTGITIRIMVGSLLVVLGLVQAEILPISFHGAERFTMPLQGELAALRRAHPTGGAILFGFVYLLIAFG